MPVAWGHVAELGRQVLVEARGHADSPGELVQVHRDGKPEQHPAHRNGQERIASQVMLEHDSQPERACGVVNVV
jgi:hypothetical protein